MSKGDEIRSVTKEVMRALAEDRWPSSAGVTDFGIATARHLGALQWAVKCDGVTERALDAALGRGKDIQALISKTNPYRDVTFKTAWDTLEEEPTARGKSKDRGREP